MTEGDQVADFDEVLERLVVDPGFAAYLANDPTQALAGYHLSADEVAMLSTQLSQDTGGEHRVERRVSKSSLFGLLSAMHSGAPITPPSIPAHDGVDQGLGAANPDLGVMSEGFGGVDQPGSGIGARLGADGVGHAGLEATHRAGFDSADRAGFDNADRAGFDRAGQDVDHDGS